jgi:hypothetical protein
MCLSDLQRFRIHASKFFGVPGELLIRGTTAGDSRFCYDKDVRDLVILVVHVIATLARLLGPGGIRSVVDESVLVKQQLLILNRSWQRSPHLRTSDRLVAGLSTLLVRPARLIRSAIVLKPSTPLNLHQAMKNRKFGSGCQIPLIETQFLQTVLDYPRNIHRIPPLLNILWLIPSQIIIDR